MRTQRRFIVLSILGALLVFSLWKKQEALIVAEPKIDGPGLSSQAEPMEISSSDTKAISNFETQLKVAAEKIAHLDSDPQKTEEELKAFSKNLEPADVQKLFKIALNRESPQDLRFLSVMLLGWSEFEGASQLLEDIATEDIDPFLSPDRQGDFESVLRMQAVEGLEGLSLGSSQHQKHLQNIISKSSSTLVIDRAQRALWASAGNADSPREQDEKALKKVLEKSEKTF